MATEAAPALAGRNLDNFDVSGAGDRALMAPEIDLPGRNKV